jgi:uncharacterized protein involved in exopolysaccharide biosynthesis
MSNDNPQDHPIGRQDDKSDEDFARLLTILIRRRWWVIGAMSSGLLLAILALWLVTPNYRSTAVAFPVVDKTSAGGLGGVLSQFSGMASMAGLDVGDNGNPEALAIIKSRQFTERFITKNALMPVLFHKDWDVARNDWKPNLRRPRTLWDGFDLFSRKVRSVTEDRKSGMLTVNVEWRDRDVAAQWANQLVAQLNEEMRQHAIDEATGMIQYLDRESEKAENMALKESISRLIESEIKERALATVRHEYAYHLIDPAEPADPLHPSSPQPKVYLIFGALGGLIIGVVAALLSQSITSFRARLREQA